MTVRVISAVQRTCSRSADDQRTRVIDHFTAGSDGTGKTRLSLALEGKGTRLLSAMYSGSKK